MRISDCSSDVWSSDLGLPRAVEVIAVAPGADVVLDVVIGVLDVGPAPQRGREIAGDRVIHVARVVFVVPAQAEVQGQLVGDIPVVLDVDAKLLVVRLHERRSDEHTSELQSLMRISYAVFCLKTKLTNTDITHLKPTLRSIMITAIIQ